MRLPRFRLRTLMIAVAAVGFILAAFVYRPLQMAVLSVVLVALSPFLGFLIYFGRKLGINTLFR